MDAERSIRESDDGMPGIGRTNVAGPWRSAREAAEHDADGAILTPEVSS